MAAAVTPEKSFLLFHCKNLDLNRRLRGRIAQGLIGLSSFPEHKQQYRELASYGNDSFPFGGLAALCCQDQSMSSQVTVGSKVSKDVLGTLYQESPELSVARFADGQLLVTIAGLIAARYQPKVSADITYVLKAFGIANGQYVTKRSDRTNTRDLLEQFCLGVMLSGRFDNLLIKFLDLNIKLIKSPQRCFHHRKDGRAL